jgi:hypothetical protein
VDFPIPGSQLMTGFEMRSGRIEWFQYQKGNKYLKEFKVGLQMSLKLRKQEIYTILKIN